MLYYALRQPGIMAALILAWIILLCLFLLTQQSHLLHLLLKLLKHGQINFQLLMSPQLPAPLSLHPLQATMHGALIMQEAVRAGVHLPAEFIHPCSAREQDLQDSILTMLLQELSGR